MEPKNYPKSEATKAGLFPPDDPAKFEAWRKSIDPDTMGFDGAEVGDFDDSDD